MESSNIQEIINQDPTLSSIYSDKELLKKNANNIEKFLVQHKGCKPDEVKAFLDNALGETIEQNVQSIFNEKQSVENNELFNINVDLHVENDTDIKENNGDGNQSLDNKLTNTNTLVENEIEAGGNIQDIAHENDGGAENSINVMADNNIEQGGFNGFSNNQSNFGQYNSVQSQSNQGFIQMENNTSINNFQQPIQQQFNNVGQTYQPQNIQPNQYNQVQQPQTIQSNQYNQVQQSNMQSNQFNNIGQIQQQQTVQYNAVQQYQPNGMQQFQQVRDIQQFQPVDYQQNTIQQSFVEAGQGNQGSKLPKIKRENWLTRLIDKIFKKKSQ